MDDLIKDEHKAVLIIHFVENTVLVMITAAIVIFSGLQIFLRNVFDTGIAWITPMLGVLVIWVGLLGALIATRNNAHIKINILTTYLPEIYRSFVFTLSHLFSAVILGILTYYSLQFVKLDFESGGIAFGVVPVWLAQSILPIVCLLMTIRYMVYTAINVVKIIRRYF